MAASGLGKPGDDRLGRPAGVHRQPDPDAVPRRGDAGPTRRASARPTTSTRARSVGLNHPMGPLELADFIGLDVCLGVMRVLHAGFGASAVRPAAGARGARRGRPPRPEDRPRVPHLPALSGQGSRVGRGPVYIRAMTETRAAAPTATSTSSAPRARPIGKFGGALSRRARRPSSAASPSAPPSSGPACRRNARIDEVLMGQVLQAGVGQAPGAPGGPRGPACPTRRSATTINRVCGSGLKAIMLAAAEIRAGDAERRVAGGMESMNQAPYLLPGARFGYRLGNGTLVDSTVHDGLWCASRTATWAPTPSGSRSSDVRQPRGPGRLRAREPPERDRRDRRGPLRRRARAGHGPRRQGPRDGRDASTRARGATPPLEALARLKPAFALPTGEDRGSATDGHRHRRQRARHHRRRRGDGRRQRARRRAARPQAARPDRRLRPGRGRPEVALPGARAGRPPAARADRAADRGVRPDRDQRGVRRADPGRRPRARLRLVEGQRERRARSRSAIRSAPAAPGSSPPCSTSWSGARAATAWPPCAWAAAARSRWPSSGSPDDDDRGARDRRPPRTGCSSPASGSTAVSGETFESRNPADTRDVDRALPGGHAPPTSRRPIRAAEMAFPGAGARRPPPSGARSCTASAR